ncbi:MAG: hypothetical protein ACI8TX_000186 [Hyphomicrobiaceae bacterium]|jgi:hypothetical protein
MPVISFLSRRLALCGAILAILLPAVPASAFFHLAHIEEVLTGVGGTDDVQFVEILMASPSQHNITGSKLSAFDANGAFLRVVLTVPSDVSSGANRSWIMGSTAFAAAAGITPDFTFASSGGQGLVPEDGMVCWGKPNDETVAEGYVDCLAYGAYVGPANSHTGTPNPENPFGHALSRVSETNNNSTDYECVDTAMPRNNASQTGSIAGTTPCAVCGNNVIELLEQCDGTDDGVCPGLCQGNCTCTNECGNDMIEGAEECDGSDDAACVGLCQFNCACAAGTPLLSDDQKCVSNVIKRASKLTSAAGKTAAKCVKDIGKGKVLVPFSSCVTADTKQKIAKADSKLIGEIGKSCNGYPYAIDCQAPCDATDGDGVSEAADDIAEVSGCLSCVSVAAAESAPAVYGVHTMLFEGVTLASLSVDKDLAKCQAALAKAADKAHSTYGKLMSKCTKSVIKNGSVPPFAAACLLDDPKGLGGKARERIDKRLGKCGSLSVPFDAGVCTGLSAAVLGDCMEAAVICSACRWGTTVLGGTQDCDSLDNLVSDGSCP